MNKKSTYGFIIMKIVPIFSNRLYALQYEGETENELSRLMELWDDAEYLFDFYENNQTYFRSDYFTTKRNILEYSNVDFLEDIEQNRNYLEQELLSIKKNEAYDMDLFFRNLYRNPPPNKVYELYKKRCHILRLYAVKIDVGLYLITGGAIKVVKEMHDHPDTNNALQQLNFISAKLHDENIKSSDQLESYIRFINEKR